MLNLETNDTICLIDQSVQQIMKNSKIIVQSIWLKYFNIYMNIKL